MNTPSTIVNKNFTAVTEGQATGSLAYWSLSGRVSAKRLDHQLEQSSYSTQRRPRLATNDRLLKRAVRAVAGRDDRILLDRHAGGYALVMRSEETTPEDQAVYVSRLHVKYEGDAIVYSNPVHPLCALITAEFESRVGQYDTGEISDFLIGLLSDLKALSLRHRGGFYYVPGTHLEEFRHAVAALRECSDHTISEIPAMSSKETASAIIDALRREVVAATAAANDFTIAGEGGKRAHKTQLRTLAGLKDKLRAYAEFMDETLDDVVGSMQAAEVTLTQGLLELEGGAA